MNDNELYHYGIPGMKWGKRKALNRQNASDYKGRGLTVAKANRQANIDKARSKSRGAKKTSTSKAVTSAKSKIGKTAIRATAVTAAAAAGSVAVAALVKKKALSKTVLGMFGHKAPYER